MAHELKPVMNNVIHNPITNLKALRSIGSPGVTIQAYKVSMEPSFTKGSGVLVESSKDAKSKVKADDSAS